MQRTITNQGNSKKPFLTQLGTIALASFLFPADLKAQQVDLKLERFEHALELTPDMENGRQKYRLCLACHGPEGWGTVSGSYPQIAGQLQTVTIKQLHDICSKQRGNPIMEAFTSPNVLETAQDVADLAAYIADLPMTNQNGKGDEEDIQEGEALYSRYCTDCHGENGEGHLEDQIPRLQGQHYNYLMRQFTWIRGGHRKNADQKMVKQIQTLNLFQQGAIMAYVASLSPPERNLAEPGWRNPDFPKYDRRWTAPPPREKPLEE